MRILQACPYAWDAPGGVQVHVRQLAGQLRRRGHEVQVIAPSGATHAGDGVRVVGRPLRVPYQGTVAPISPWPSTAARTRAAVRAFRPDVVHAHEPLTPSVAMYAAFAARSAGASVAATFHAHVESSRLFDVASIAVRPVWNRLAVRIAVSEAAARFVRSRMGGAVEVIPNGLDIGAFASARPAGGLPDGRRVLWVGRLDPQKGFDIALEAFGVLLLEQPDAVLVVVGDGAARRLVDGLPGEVRRRVFMVGAVDHPRLPPYHAAADVFVAPATGQESFGYVIVEAMAAGVPVVATDIAGYREVVRGGLDGLLVPPSDPIALAAALRRVLAEPDLARRLGEAGRRRAAGFDWDRVVVRIEEQYERALARPSPEERPPAKMPIVLGIWLIIAAVVVLAIYVVYVFNKLVRTKNRVNNAWSQIDVQLRRRYDLIPNLVETVKGYAAHERELFEEVTQARASGQQAQTVQDQATAENQLTSGLRRLIAVAENYPELKANQNFLALQEELTSTESKIAFARQFYNDQVTILNNLIQSFPSNIVAKIFAYQPREFFEIDETAARGPVTTSFS